MEGLFRYLETFKAYEKKGPEDIQGKTDTSYTSQFAEALTKVRGINKTDSNTLMSHFSNLAGVTKADKETISQCPGFGDKKVQSLLDALHKPFTGRGPSNIQRRKVGLQPVESWRQSEAHVGIDDKDSQEEEVEEINVVEGSGEEEGHRTSITIE